MMSAIFYAIILFSIFWTGTRMGLTHSTGGILYPRPSKNREVISLDGVWNFILDSEKQLGITQEWYTKDISLMEGAMLMPVPSSYNDITTLESVRDHIGLVWYDRIFYVSNSWRNENTKVWLRFSSVYYHAHVWVNGKKVMEHEIGHLPFKEEITDFVKFGVKNKLTVAVDNILSNETVPQGVLKKVNITKGHKLKQSYEFDFFNYGGIQRSVHLYTTPQVYIDDINLSTGIQDGEAFIKYILFYKGYSETDPINSLLSVFDKEGTLVCHQTCNNSSIENGTVNISNNTGRVNITNPKLWWPYLMHSEPGYLYTIEIALTSTETSVTDFYTLSYGLRTLKWDNNSIYINDKPIYIRGFGRHEDSDIRGKGLDLPTAVKDHNLLKWIGANAYRTTNYPYAEEIMELAESQGIMVIDESPSIGLKNFSDSQLNKHKMSIAEMVSRDKNLACVIMWSVSSEAESNDALAEPYFKEVVSYLRSLDNTRPITATTNREYKADKAAQFLDVICFTRYSAWYNQLGHLDTIQTDVEEQAQNWRDKYLMPVIMSEFGAETYEGLHMLPEYVWSEEYQEVLLSEHYKAFDNLRKKGWFIGEIIWTFADYKTERLRNKVASNKKGIFTRQRQPKSAAYLVRKRFYQLASSLDGAKLPRDLYKYSSDISTCEEKY